jgi:hypothetical protein
MIFEKTAFYLASRGLAGSKTNNNKCLLGQSSWEPFSTQVLVQKRKSSKSVHHENDDGSEEEDGQDEINVTKVTSAQALEAASILQSYFEQQGSQVRIQQIMTFQRHPSKTGLITVKNKNPAYI